MIPGKLIAPGQLTDPGVNFASVHVLTPVTVHMSFSLPRGNFDRRATRCTTPRACSHDPGTTHCPGATHSPRGQLCLGARSDTCNCSHEFFVAPGQLREAGYPLYSTG